MVLDEDKKMLAQMVWGVPSRFREGLWDEITLCFSYEDFLLLWHKVEHLQIPFERLDNPSMTQINKYLLKKVSDPNT